MFINSHPLFSRLSAVATGFAASASDVATIRFRKIVQSSFLDKQTGFNMAKLCRAGPMHPFRVHGRIVQ